MVPQGRSVGYIVFRNALIVLFVFGLQVAVNIPSIHAWSLSTPIVEKDASLRTYSLTKSGDAPKSSAVLNTCQKCSSPSRRHFVSVIPKTLATSLCIAFASLAEPAVARNLPVSNGANTSNVGTALALIPLVRLRSNLVSLSETLRQQRKNNLDEPLKVISKTKTALSFTTNIEPITIPIREEDFKRLFDAYSDQVSYKQKFLDQNAFLVYYTKGYDGPGRDSLEKDPVNERQTMQFGARNEAWICWDDFLAEFDFYVSSSTNGDDTEEGFADMMKYLSNTIQAVDIYLKLSPPDDLKEAEREVS